MSNAVAISVIIPAYNEEKLIAESLTTLVNQKFTLPFEIVVINNNSTDKTLEIAKKFPVKIINEFRQGVVFARQKGLVSAVGEFVVCADCDCQYPQNWLANIYNHFNKSAQVVAVGGPAEAENIPRWAYNIYKYGFKLVNFIYNYTGFVLYLGAFNFAYRRQIFLKLGGYRTYLELGGGDEIDPLQRLRTAGKIVFDPNLKIKISLRRYRVGFWRWFVIHNLYYYFVGYLLCSIFKRPLIKPVAVRNI